MGHCKDLDLIVRLMGINVSIMCLTGAKES